MTAVLAGPVPRRRNSRRRNNLALVIHQIKY